MPVGVKRMTIGHETRAPRDSLHRPMLRAPLLDCRASVWADLLSASCSTFVPGGKSDGERPHPEQSRGRLLLNAVLVTAISLLDFWSNRDRWRRLSPTRTPAAQHGSPPRPALDGRRDYLPPPGQPQSNTTQPTTDGRETAISRPKGSQRAERISKFALRIALRAGEWGGSALPEAT
jgi:hypothetical protein